MVINSKKSRTIKTVLTFLVVGLLTGFVSYTYAKFFTSISTPQDGAGSAKWGTIDIREHILIEEIPDEESEEKVKYRFSEETYPIENNSETLYTNLRTGKNIPFYPCVYLKGTFEVSFWLYLKIVETNYNDYKPIEFHIDAEKWEKGQYNRTPKNGAAPEVITTIYRYKNKLPNEVDSDHDHPDIPGAGSTIEKEIEINILEHNALHVTKEFDIEHYDGYDLKLSAWIQQINDPSKK
ncbi:MAG: hypothetical protein J1F31_00395 [Erysipelotrichales bacterium]|nr:hypothetical protein [Erysipelotrichales bacterium]